MYLEWLLALLITVGIIAGAIGSQPFDRRRCCAHRWAMCCSYRLFISSVDHDVVWFTQPNRQGPRNPSQKGCPGVADWGLHLPALRAWLCGRAHDSDFGRADREFAGCFAPRIFCLAAPPRIHRELAAAAWPAHLGHDTRRRLRRTSPKYRVSFVIQAYSPYISE